MYFHDESKRVIFIRWLDDGAPIKAKMCYQRSKGATKSLKDGVHGLYEATERSDLDEARMAKEAEGGMYEM